MVEGVKGFKAQFDGLAFVDANVLFNRHVPVVNARAVDRVTVGSSESCTGSAHCEGRGAIREPVVACISCATVGIGLVGARIHPLHRCHLVGTIRTGEEGESIIVTSKRMAAEVKYWNRESTLKGVDAHYVPVIGQPSETVPRELVEGQRVLVADHQALRCIVLGRTIGESGVVRVQSGEVKRTSFKVRSLVKVPGPRVSDLEL